MHPLDFISGSPNLYLFQKESIKTNFGGFLFLIYLVVIILIVIYYIIDYVKNDKYIIQSFTNTNIDLGEDKEEFYNPNVNFTIDAFVLLKNHKDSHYFKIYDNKLSKFIDPSMIFTKKVKDFDIDILYECNDTNCSNYDDVLKEFRKNEIYTYSIKISHDYFFLDHQNKNSPIIKNKDGYNIFYKTFTFSTVKSSDLILNWKNIEYKEKKGFFKKDWEDHCGYIESDEKTSYELTDYITLSEDKTKKRFLPLCNIYFRVDNTQFIEYFRKRISELDIIANILSLIANIFSCVKIGYGFYSNYFINFKIVEKILNKNIPTKKILKIEQSSEMNDLENNKFISINDDIKEKCLDKNNNEDNQNSDNNNKDDAFEIESDNYESLSQDIPKLKKLHFFDFFLNNIYSLCKKRKAQKIIHLCNKIVYKYASIDTLVQNQIILENLFKDYKWNQPSLNNEENNNLFIQLKTYL